MVVTKRVIVPRTPAIAGNHNSGNKGRSVRQDGVGQEEGQRIRPSSQASLEAAASSATSVDSQPPFGTLKNGRISKNAEVERARRRDSQTQ
jgi:hypothetical protein